jgi:hypothetical protein
MHGIFWFLIFAGINPASGRLGRWLRPDMRIRMIRPPPVQDVDGIDLSVFRVGVEYDLGNSLASLFLAEGWAEPIPLDAPSPPVPFSADDPFTMPVIDRRNPPNLVKEQHPPYVEREVAADIRRRRRKR